MHSSKEKITAFTLRFTNRMSFLQESLSSANLLIQGTNNKKSGKKGKLVAESRL